MVSLAQKLFASTNSNQLLESVVYSMIAGFSELRLPTDSPVVSLSHKGRSVTVNEATVLQVQQFLISEGQLDGSADGQFGAKTAEALEKWQENADLTPNGLPDMVTLFLISKKIKQ